MANVADALIRALPEDDIAGPSVGFTHRGAIVVIQRRSISVIRINIQATYIVVNPVHKARAIKTAIAIQIFAAPNIRQADVLLGIH